MNAVELQAQMKVVNPVNLAEMTTRLKKEKGTPEYVKPKKKKDHPFKEDFDRQMDKFKKEPDVG